MCLRTRYRDENRPVCGLCQKCGFICNGPRDIVFVEGKIPKSRTTVDRTTILAKYATANTHTADHQIAVHFSLKVNETEVYLCYSLKHIRGGPVDLALQDTQLTDLLTAGTRLLEMYFTLPFSKRNGKRNQSAREGTNTGVA